MSSRSGRFAALRDGIARRIAPPRFVLFVLVTCAVAAAWHFVRQGSGWEAFAAGFDIGVIAFALSLLPLRNDRGEQIMREHSAQNNAKRGLVLVLTAGALAAILVAISLELPSARCGDVRAVTGLIVTLLLAWIFANLVFMLHYAYMHYAPAPGGQSHDGGFEFPGTPEPDYGDFLYFAVTAGMSFAASDVDVTRGAVRRVVVAHCLLSFLFNIGVLAFSINVLAGVATADAKATACAAPAKQTRVDSH